MNTKLMTNNVKSERMGVVPQVDIGKDLAPKDKYNVNSWFAFGRFEVDGHILNYLFHIMALKLPIMGLRYQSVVSVSDETTGFYYAKDYLFKPKEIKVTDNDFYIEMPNGVMSGNWDKMQIKVHESDLVIDTEVTAIHYPIFSRGSSVFELLDMTIHQFSVPFMKTCGKFSIQGQTYDVTNKGFTWFDRQWQEQDFKAPIKWSWMAIYLDSGEVISVLDSDVPGNEEGLISILKNDGSQFNSTDVPAFKYGESEYWYSEKSKQKYPTKWNLDIPVADAKLEVTPVIKKQEIASVMKALSKYEGVSLVDGSYKGKKVTGHGIVELIGTWPK